MKNFILLLSFMLFAGMAMGQALKVGSDGNVAIGHGSPQFDLHVVDEGNVSNVVCERQDADNFVFLGSGCLLYTSDAADE